MDLSTEYMGFNLKNPIVPSSSPLSGSIDGIRQLEDAGAAAVVMGSLFEEKVAIDGLYLDFYLTHGSYSEDELLRHFPDVKERTIGADEYLNMIRRAKDAVDIPIVGSLNGVSTGGWTEYSGLIEEAGADGLELNVYYIPTSPYLTGAEVETVYMDLLRDVKRLVSIPVAMKLSPYFSSTANVAQRLTEEGAGALVLFNRFYQPDFDLEKLEGVQRLVLSVPDELRLPLTWVAILYGRVPVDLAITGGIHSYQDVLKTLMVGAKVAMMTSELLKNGVGRIGEILTEMAAWMERHQCASVRQIIGCMSQENVAEPATFQRANYLKMLASYREVK